MDKINRLTQLNVEIEGLLRILAARQSDNAKSILADKFKEFSALFEDLLKEDTPLTDECISLEKDIASALTSDEVKDQEAVESELPDSFEMAESEIHHEAKNDEEGVSVPAGEDAKIQIEDDDCTCILPENEKHIGVEDAKEVMPELIGLETVEKESEAAIPDDSDSLHVEDKVNDLDESRSVSEPEQKSATAGDTQDVRSDNNIPQHEESVVIERDETPSASNDIRVDEALSRREARDLKRAFTLNDKFRFRRGLFGNNDSIFADTLNTLMAMNSFDEAEEYLYIDMGWNREDEDVIDFVSIVKNHFAGLA